MNPARILVVDDAEGIRTYLANLLEFRVNFLCYSRRNGKYR